MSWSERCLRPPSIWILIGLALALWSAEFLRRGLWEPDEARYAYVAREMRDGGHWWVPHLSGNPYPDKPPLMFWLINAASLVTGGQVTSVSARMPSLLGSIMSLWVVARLLGNWAGGRAAWRGVLILMTSFLFWQEGSWGRIDALLCGLVMMSVYCLLRYHSGGGALPWGRAEHDGTANRIAEVPKPAQGAWRMLVTAYLFAGLAVLAKGPIGLVLPLGIYVAMVVAQKEAATLRRWHWFYGVALACAIPGFWLWMAWRQGAPSEYFDAMFGVKSFGRVVASKGHAQPFYYFLWHFPLEFLPWMIFLPGAVLAMRDRALKRKLLAWGGFVIVLFSLFVCKRNLYVLAAFPAAAMLVAAAWEDCASLSVRWRTVTARMAMGLIGVLALSMTVSMVVPQMPVRLWEGLPAAAGKGLRTLAEMPINSWTLLPSAVVLWAGGVILWRLHRRDGLSHRWLVAFATVLFVNQVAISAFILPALSAVKSPNAFAAEVRARLAPGQPLHIFQGQWAILPFYAERPGREIHSVEALKALIESGTPTVVVFNPRQWERVKPQLRTAGTEHPFRTGSKHLVWVEYPAAPSG